MGNLYKYDNNWNLISSFSVGTTLVQGIDWIGDGDKYIVSTRAGNRKSVSHSYIDWAAGALYSLTTLQQTVSLLNDFIGCAFSKIGFGMEDSGPFDHIYFGQIATSFPTTYSVFKEDLFGNRISTIINGTSIFVNGMDVNDRNGDLYVADGSAVTIRTYTPNGVLKRNLACPVTAMGDIFFDGTHFYIPDTGGGAKITQTDMNMNVISQSPAFGTSPKCVTGNGTYFVVGD